MRFRDCGRLHGCGLFFPSYFLGSSPLNAAALFLAAAAAIACGFVCARLWLRLLPLPPRPPRPADPMPGPVPPGPRPAVGFVPPPGLAPVSVVILNVGWRSSGKSPVCESDLDSLRGDCCYRSARACRNGFAECQARGSDDYLLPNAKTRFGCVSLFLFFPLLS